MAVPLTQQLRISKYILGKKLRGEARFPLVLMLEPLFRCNLACSGCGKIDYPEDILDKRLSVEECMQAVDECGVPVVSIAGGEPLIHRDMPEIVRGFIAKKKYVYLCTNALLLERRMADYSPSHYLTFSIHLDGNRDRHDASVCRSGVFDKCISVIKEAREKGFRVTINCTLFQGETAGEVAEFMDMAMELGVEGVTTITGLQLRTGAAPGRVSETQGEQTAVQGHLQAGGREEVAFQPVVPVPGLPGGQPAIPVHALGQSHPECFRLAETLLPVSRRGLRAHLQCPDGRNGMAQVRQRD